MNDNIYPVARLGDFEKILLVNKSDLPFIGKDRAMEVKTIRIDLGHETIDEPTELELHLKFNPWEEITSDDERKMVSDKIRFIFTPEEIESRVSSVLVKSAIK